MAGQKRGGKNHGVGFFLYWKIRRHEIRVVGYGVRSGDFDSLAKDPRGIKMKPANRLYGRTASRRIEAFNG